MAENLWNEIEAAARRKLGLGDEYKMYYLELLPHDCQGRWDRAKVGVGIKLAGHGHETWVAKCRTVVKRTELEGSNSNA